MFLHVHRDRVINSAVLYRKDKNMSVQQLSSTYIQSLKARNNGAQLDSFIQNGTIIEKDGKYFVAGKNIQMFSFDGAFEVDETGKPKEYQFNVKGAVVERTAEQKEGQVVKETKETTFQFNQLTELMKLPEDKKEEFKAFLKSEGINIDDSGEIKTNNNKAIQDAVNKYVEQNKANFVRPGGEYIEFDESSDPAGIAELEKPNDENTKPAITKLNDRYAVTNRDALNEALPTEDAPLTYEAADGRSASLTGSTVTTTERKRADLEVPADLKNNKDARKTLEAQARERYADFAADPNNRDAVDLYVAESKYEKQINKREQELLKMHDHSGKKTTRNAADVVQLYMDKYANPKDAKAMNDVVGQLMDTKDEEDQQKLLEILKRDLKAYGVDENSKFSDLSPVQKRNAALIAVSEANGTNPKDLLRLMAMQDVMGARTTEQIADDDKFFIKHQAEDYVKNRQANQEFPNAKINLDNMGKHGRKLVDKCPELFGDQVSEAEYRAGDKNNFYKAEVFNVKTGRYETKHFKFNNKVWNTFMKVACDPTSANDEDIRLLSDHNMTLQEGRAGLEMRVPTNDGRMEELRKIIGNSNDKTGNRELNRWRDLVEQTGLSVDSNPTAAKRLWHVVKNTGIGVGVGLLTGGIGSLFGATVAYAGQTAAQMVPYIASANPKVSFSFDSESKDFTKWVKTTDTVTTIVDGEEYTNKTTHNTPVTITAEGQTYNGQIINNPETGQPELWVNGEKYPGKVNVENTEVKGEVEAKGQDYEGDKNTRWQQMKNAGILGGIAGAARGVATMNKVDAKGRNTDDVYDFTYMEPDVKEEETNFTLEIPQYSTVEKRSGDKEGGAVEEFKAKKWQGPAAYGIMYQYDDGTPVNPRDFAKAYQAKIGGAMSRGKFYAFPELEINGKKIVLRNDYAEQYKKVPEGTQGSVREVNYNNTAQRRHIAGTIRRG